MTIQQYLEILNSRYRSGISREHSYCADLNCLIHHIFPDINLTKEPADMTNCGNSHYVLTQDEIPVGFIEAKDIGKDNVPKVAWEFYIGGYKPAQKWLKDRKLSFEEILHYQKIIVPLTETDILMKEIIKTEN